MIWYCELIGLCGIGENCVLLCIIVLSGFGGIDSLKLGLIWLRSLFQSQIVCRTVLMDTLAFLKLGMNLS